VAALAVEQRTVVAGETTVRTGAVELYTADATHVVFRHVPAPDGRRVVGGYLDFHLGGVYSSNSGAGVKVG